MAFNALDTAPNSAQQKGFSLAVIFATSKLENQEINIPFVLNELTKYILGNKLILKQASLWEESPKSLERLSRPLHTPTLCCNAIITITYCLSYSVNTHFTLAMWGKFGISQRQTVSCLCDCSVFTLCLDCFLCGINSLYPLRKNTEQIQHPTSLHSFRAWHCAR